MIISTSTEETKDIDYPCLMISKTSKSIVFFKKRGEGTVLKINDNDRAWQLGEFCNGFNMDVFEIYNGTVTLKNG